MKRYLTAIVWTLLMVGCAGSIFGYRELVSCVFIGVGLILFFDGRITFPEVRR